jgi:RHS repeat-associated protein
MSACTYTGFSRQVTISHNGTSSTYVYDGNGARVKVTNNETILYINKYFEKNLSSNETTSYYYLGDRLVAQKVNTNLSYVHQDHLTGTSLMTDADGDSLGTIKYTPFGETRSGSVPTDKLFTGQRLDDTGLYYYGARYYDAGIGRFVSPDPVVQTGPLPFGRLVPALVVSFAQEKFLSLANTPNTPIIMRQIDRRVTNRSMTNPQELNRYTYGLNNPLSCTDPEGNQDVLTWGQNLQQIGNSLPPQIGVWCKVAGGALVVGFSIWLYFSNRNEKADTDKNGKESDAKRGKAKAPKTGDPDSDYYQTDEQGNVRSHTHYDENGNVDYREDFDHTHGSIEGPHRHDFLFDKNGHQIDPEKVTPIKPKK